MNALERVGGKSCHYHRTSRAVAVLLLNITMKNLLAVSKPHYLSTAVHSYRPDYRLSSSRVASLT
eukprot:scaffold5169_cov172-Amphora_coffeaeformis.AAC.29